MFLARVLVGQHCVGKASMKAPPVRGENTFETFDTTVNKATDPSVFVTFHDSQTYPE